MFKNKFEFETVNTVTNVLKNNCSRFQVNIHVI